MMRDAADIALLRPSAFPTADRRGQGASHDRAEAESRDRPSRIEVVFATRGRASCLAAAVAAVDAQSLGPTTTTISCVIPADAGALARRRDVKLLLGPPGLARQRNLALEHLDPETEIVVFFDDDFLPHRAWIEEVERCFRRDPGIAAVSGHVIADGIKGPGIAPDRARALLADPALARSDWIRENFSPYGCNMAFRRSAIAGLRFDERLVLYGWLEDRDFGGMLARRGGRLVQSGAAMGVHLGVKVGRVSGRRLGYSQIANPAHLYGKGTMTLKDLAWHWFKNVASNLVMSIRPEPFIDRRGRLAGNLTGFRDLVMRNARPERAERL